MEACAKTIALFVLLAAIVPANAQESVRPTSAWISAVTARQPPETAWLEIMDSTHCEKPACSRQHWTHFLAGMKLSDLTVPPGDRAYRWFWVGTDSTGPLGFQIPRKGFVEVRIDTSGRALIRSTWSQSTITLDAKQLEPFEAALARTQFANLPSQDGSSCLDECQDQIMEAVVDGRYHYIARNGGISEPGIRDAGVILEQIGRTAAGK